MATLKDLFSKAKEFLFPERPPLVATRWHEVPNPIGSVYSQAPTPTPASQFGIGSEETFVEPSLFDYLMSVSANDRERRLIAELSGQESSYWYNKQPHITEKEESYGPFHINVKAGRKNPKTGKPFTKEEALDIKTAVNYALEEMRRTGGLGAWNPGAYDFYQYDLPKRSESKLYKRGE